MPETTLQGKRVAILAADLYEDPELWYPYYRLREAGAEVSLVGPEANKTYDSKHGYPVTTELAAADASPEDFDGIVVPGGYAPDKLRRSDAVLNLVRGIHERGGMVAAICHAGWVPISAGIMNGKTATCFYAIKDDLMNAGAEYVDEPVVVDGNLITSRTPDDLPYFLPAIIGALAEVEEQVAAE
ncbi:MAG TPA: type 1 glutamine amidotransferase domain-containing protein [bacterium]|nr:type 1 glutamine amidotransferase domain-containing protein [bacterium]